jgi:hypothetical protein
VPPDVAVHTLVVVDVKLTDKPLVADAESSTLNVPLPNVASAIGSNVID